MIDPPKVPSSGDRPKRTVPRLAAIRCRGIVAADGGDNGGHVGFCAMDDWRILPIRAPDAHLGWRNVRPPYRLWLRFDYVYKTLSFDTFTNAYIPRNANDEFCKLVFIFERAFIDTIIYFIRNMNLCMLQTFHIVFDIICQIQRRL